jgi:hypothetical protein
MGARFRRAKQDWSGFPLGRELKVAAVGLVAGAGALWAFGFPGAAIEQVVVVLASGIALLALVPLLDLAWCWLRAPHRELSEEVSRLSEDVVDLRAEVETLRSPRASAPKKIDVELTLKNYARRGQEIGQDPLLRLSATAGEVPIESWTSQVLDVLTTHLGRAAVERFLSASEDTTTSRQRLDARLAVLREIIDDLPKEQ